MLSFNTASAQQHYIRILSATEKSKRIEGAEVSTWNGGKQIANSHSDADGIVSLTPAAPDNEATTIIIKKDGYVMLTAKCPCDSMGFALSPVMKSPDALRIVLNWSIMPPDLDAQLAYGSSHIYMESKSGPNARLDNSSIFGCGPETITIEKRAPGTPYIYAVQDFTNRNHPESMSLSDSRGKVIVYKGNTELKAYNVPAHTAGNLWTVFQINADGTIKDINLIGGSGEEARNFSFNYLKNNVGKTLPPDYYLTIARQYNSRGEEAYRKGNMGQALDYYLSAVNADPNYGQAYSSMAMVFRKKGEDNDALKANLKAIEVSKGPEGRDVRAASCYNIGRIYEDIADWLNALKYYQMAEGEKDNPIYRDAVNRMQPLVK